MCECFSLGQCLFCVVFVIFDGGSRVRKLSHLSGIPLVYLYGLEECRVNGEQAEQRTIHQRAKGQ